MFDHEKNQFVIRTAKIKILMSFYDGIMLVQPFEPQKEMTNLWDLRDSNGVYIIRELIKTAESQSGSGYVSYHQPESRSGDEACEFEPGNYAGGKDA